MIKSPVIQGISRSNDILISQRIEAAEAALTLFLPCVETENTYDIVDKKSNKQIMTIRENSSTLCRFCCSPYHNATLIGTLPNSNKSLFTIQKPFKCFHLVNLCPICISTGSVSVNGTTVGSVKERYFTGFTPVYDLSTPNNPYYSSISGPTGLFGGILDGATDITLSVDSDKPVYATKLNNFNSQQDPGYNEMGRFLSGGIRSTISDADFYSLTFSPNMSDVEKVNLITAIILMDYHLFESDVTDANGCYLCTCYFMGCVQACKCNGENNRRS